MMVRSIFFVFILMCSLSVLAQRRGRGSEEQISSEARERFSAAKAMASQKMYREAIDQLDQATQDAPTWAEAWFLKADYVRKLTDIDGKYDVKREISLLEMALACDSINYPTYHFYLGEEYYNQGEYVPAYFCYEKYLRIDSLGRRVSDAKFRLKSCDFAIEALDKQVKYRSKLYYERNTDIYGMTFDIIGKTLLFTALEKGKIVKSEIHGGVVMRKYEQIIDVENIYTKIGGKAVPANFNTQEYCEGMPSLTPDGQFMYFTGCGGSGYNTRCDIFVAQRIDDYMWYEPVNVGAPVSTDGWEAQPSISPDGQKLYFVSTREGGKGESDIWCSKVKKRLPNGKIEWDKPECLWFNTAGREMTPFIFNDGHTLFFASDGLVGMGGMDIFCVDLDQPGSEPINLGISVNTVKDESGLILDPSGKQMYFIQENPKTNKKAIYTTPLPDHISCTPASYIRIDIEDEYGHKVYPKQVLIQRPEVGETGDTLDLFNAANYMPQDMVSVLPQETTLLITVVAENYMYYSDTLYTGKGSYEHPVFYQVKMQELKEELVESLDGIYFENNSSELSPKSKCELGQLIEFMKANPTAQIEVRGYTDNVGSQMDNQKLSEDRAYEVYKYLLTHYVHYDRVRFVGYGARNPRATNNTDEGRAQNRRVEIYIMSLYGFYDY